MTPHPNIVCESPRPRVHVARFIRPDLRGALYDAEPSVDCDLYQELAAAAGFAALAPGDALVLNFGLVEWFPTIFYRFLVALRADLHARQVHLLLCNLPPLVREVFDILGGGRLFDVRLTESRAVADASK